MKKHIKKKFLNEFDLPQEHIERMKGNTVKVTQEEMGKLKPQKDMTPFLMTESSYFQAFFYKYQGKPRLIPEPDPVLVYFHSAYANYKQIKEKRKQILKPLLEPVMGEPLINDWYEYFGLTCGFAIFLFTTLEAFVNRFIPKSYEYRKADTKMTAIYNKSQIEEYLSFNDKIKIILPEVTSKDFFKAHPPTAIHITNLKEFRDSIIHTKTSKEALTYDYLFKKSLDFKYEETINAVAAFCNFYYPGGNYIVECDCKNDW